MATLSAVDDLSALLEDVNVLSQRDLLTLWRAVQDRDPEYIREALSQGVPEVVEAHARVAADLTATWYEELDPASAFDALPASPPPVEKVQQTTVWAANALFRPGTATPLDLLSGAVQRLVFNTSRQTVMDNSRVERVPWARITRGDSKTCPFCRLLASRGYVYGSQAQATQVGASGLRRKYDYKGASWSSRGLPEATVQRGRMDRAVQKLGEGFHDRCRCKAVPDRGGAELPAITEQYRSEYYDAVNETGGTNLKAVLAAMSRAH